MNEGCGFVGGVIVENEDLHIRVVAVGDGADAWGESEFLVAGRNENGDSGRRMDNRIHRGESEDPKIQQVIKGDENKTAQNEDMKKFY